MSNWRRWKSCGFGVSHDALGAALCESWGLGGAAVACVRHHVEAQAGGELPEGHPRRAITALSVIARALMVEPDTLDDTVKRVASAADFDLTLALRAARRVQEQLLASAAAPRLSHRGQCPIAGSPARRAA